MKTFGYVGGVILAFLAITWVIQGNDFFLTKAFAPKEEAVRRQTFEQSKAYNQGMVQTLERDYIEYSKAKDPQERQAIASVVLHDYVDYDQDQLPPDLYDFVQRLKSDSLKGNDKP